MSRLLTGAKWLSLIANVGLVGSGKSQGCVFFVLARQPSRLSVPLLSSEQEELWHWTHCSFIWNYLVSFSPDFPRSQPKASSRRTARRWQLTRICSPRLTRSHFSLCLPLTHSCTLSSEFTQRHSTPAHLERLLKPAPPVMAVRWFTVLFCSQSAALVLAPLVVMLGLIKKKKLLMNCM